MLGLRQGECVRTRALRRFTIGQMRHRLVCRVDVIDNGPGVSADDRQKIFSLFESRKGARGTGLGLPVSAKILSEHGGDIQIMDPPNGSGCQFRLRLPIECST